MRGRLRILVCQSTNIGWQALPINTTTPFGSAFAAAAEGTMLGSIKAGPEEQPALPGAAGCPAAPAARTPRASPAGRPVPSLRPKGQQHRHLPRASALPPPAAAGEYPPRLLQEDQAPLPKNMWNIIHDFTTMDFQKSGPKSKKSYEWLSQTWTAGSVVGTSIFFSLRTTARRPAANWHFQPVEARERCMDQLEARDNRRQRGLVGIVDDQR
eukprot:SAG22_NODE_233_length_14378_cov_86.382100_8_plen_212_part_00